MIETTRRTSPNPPPDEPFLISEMPGDRPITAEELIRLILMEPYSMFRDQREERNELWNIEKLISKISK